MRAISQTYRPEFQNRIDKIIVFRPLTRELMRVILKKELNGVLERRGLKDRDWAVNGSVGAGVSLLERGFSPEMGARPLKRAIEQYVIAGRSPPPSWSGAFPKATSSYSSAATGARSRPSSSIRTNDDEAPALQAQRARVRRPTLAAMILAPGGTAAEFDALTDKISGIERSLASQSGRSSSIRLSDEMSSVDFWKQADRFEKLARARADGPGRRGCQDRRCAAHAARARLASARALFPRADFRASPCRSIWSARASRIVFEGSAVEVAITVEPALETGDNPRPAPGADSSSACIATGPRTGTCRCRGQRQRRASILLVTGFGAHRVLSRECGLHILELTDSNGNASRANGAGSASRWRRSATCDRQAAPGGDRSIRQGRAALGGGAALSRRARPASAQRRWQRAHRQARCGAARRLRFAWRRRRVVLIAGDRVLVALDHVLGRPHGSHHDLGQLLAVIGLNSILAVWHLLEIGGSSWSRRRRGAASRRSASAPRAAPRRAAHLRARRHELEQVPIGLILGVVENKRTFEARDVRQRNLHDRRMMRLRGQSR